MTCNPFGSLNSKYSASVLTADNIDAASFGDLLDLQFDPSKKYDTEKLNEACANFKKLLSQTDLTPYALISERQRQMSFSAASCTELAEFLDFSAISLDDFLDSVNTELANINPNVVTEGVLSGINLIDYDRTTPPGIFTNVRSGEASFDIVIGNKGIPLANISNPGSGFSRGELINITDEGLNITYRVAETTNLTSLSEGGESDIESIFNQFDYFLNENIGTAITKKQCSSINLSFLFNLLQTGKFIVQLPDLISSVWSEFANLGASLPSLLGALRDSIFSIVDKVVEQAMKTIDNIKKQIIGFAKGFQHLYKKIRDTENFFSELNITKIKAMAERIMANMVDQFEQNPETAINIILWILSRLCQLSSALSDFMQAPVSNLNNLLAGYRQARAELRSVSGSNLIAVAEAGGVRGDYDQMRARAAAALANANAANATAAPPDQLLIPQQWTTADFTDAERAFIYNNRSAAGIPGVCKFVGGVFNVVNDDRQGNAPRAGGFMNVQLETFARLRRVAERMGQEFNITSAYRSANHPAESWKEAPGTGAHCQGLALDVVMVGVDIPRFIQTASQEGFTGIAYYPYYPLRPDKPRNFTHIDTQERPPGERTWSTAPPELTAAVKRAINLHRNDQFRSGQS